jgi:arylsulfatase A-like enzyme
MDHNIGRIVRRLDELGVRDNTVVIFTSDQGHCCGHKGIWGKGNSTVPYNMYDESIRVPLVWNHPGRIKPGESRAAVSSYDFMQTLLEYVGVRAPADAKGVGRSYAGVLRGERWRQPNELFFEYGYVRALRTEGLKYIERTGHPSELFDLKGDPHESANVIDDRRYAARLAQAKARLGRFFRDSGAPPLANWQTTTTQKLPVYS